MPLWGKINNANSAPKYTTSVVSGKTGIQDYGNTVIFVTGSEGFHVSPGWAKKTVGTGARAGRVFYESLVALPSIAFGQGVVSVNAVTINGQAVTINNQYITATKAT